MLVGAHLDNVDQPPEDSFRRLRLMRAEVAVTLWTSGTRHRKSVYQRLKAAGVQRVCIRVGDEWIAGPVQDYLRDVDEAIANAVAGGFPESAIDCQILNEPNLKETDPARVGGFVGDVVRGWRRMACIIHPPVSRGVPGWRVYERWMWESDGDWVGPVLRGVHCYADDAENLEAREPGQPEAAITEFGRADISGRARGLWTVERLKEFARKGYLYACQFIVGGESHGAWPQSYVMTDAEAIVVGERGSLPEPDKEPTLELPGIDEKQRELAHYEANVWGPLWQTAELLSQTAYHSDHAVAEAIKNIVVLSKVAHGAEAA